MRIKEFWKRYWIFFGGGLVFPFLVFLVGSALPYSAQKTFGAVASSINNFLDGLIATRSTAYHNFITLLSSFMATLPFFVLIVVIFTFVKKGEFKKMSLGTAFFLFLGGYVAFFLLGFLLIISFMHPSFP